MSVSFDFPDTFVSYPILQVKKPRFREVLPLRVAQRTSEGIVIGTQFWCELHVTCNLSEFKKLLFSLYHPCRLHGVGEGGLAGLPGSQAEEQAGALASKIAMTWPGLSKSSLSFRMVTVPGSIPTRMPGHCP